MWENYQLRRRKRFFDLSYLFCSFTEVFPLERMFGAALRVDGSCSLLPLKRQCFLTWHTWLITKRNELSHSQPKLGYFTSSRLSTHILLRREVESRMLCLQTGQPVFLSSASSQRGRRNTRNYYIFLEYNKLIACNVLVKQEGNGPIDQRARRAMKFRQMVHSSTNF